MKFVLVELNDSKNAHASMIINMDFITRIDINTNFVALADGAELILTEESMINLLFECKSKGANL